jgi:hypothetical protein
VTTIIGGYILEKHNPTFFLIPKKIIEQ